MHARSSARAPRQSRIGAYPHNNLMATSSQLIRFCAGVLIQGWDTRVAIIHRETTARGRLSFACRVNSLPSSPRIYLSRASRTSCNARRLLTGVKSCMLCTHRSRCSGRSPRRYKRRIATLPSPVSPNERKILLGNFVPRWGRAREPGTLYETRRTQYIHRNIDYSCAIPSPRFRLSVTMRFFTLPREWKDCLMHERYQNRSSCPFSEPSG